MRPGAPASEETVWPKFDQKPGRPGDTQHVEDRFEPRSGSRPVPILHRTRQEQLPRSGSSVRELASLLSARFAGRRKRFGRKVMARRVGIVGIGIMGTAMMRNLV